MLTLEYIADYSQSLWFAEWKDHDSEVAFPWVTAGPALDRADVFGPVAATLERAFACFSLELVPAQRIVLAEALYIAR